MKKYLVVFAALFLIMGLAGQAKAYFTTYPTGGDLIRVVYQVQAGTVSGYEEATDLGSITSIESNPSLFSDSGYNLTTGNGTNNFNLSNGPLYVAYFAYTGHSNLQTSQLWTSGTAVSEQNLPSVWGVTVNAAGTIVAAYNTAASSGSSANAWVQTSGSSYFKIFDGGSLQTTGLFDGYINTPGGESVLDPLNVAGNGSITQATQYIFKWSPMKTSNSNNAGDFEIVTTLGTNGIITSQAESIAPIPPSVLLFGSGLLGLIGVMRKKLI
ncbi:MAG TPA: hypothetical protein VEF34_13410 [Syntrophobacteraceae bacterium]|nr:hypothetical protein [Syntrophobacteraceae bacterium]